MSFKYSNWNTVWLRLRYNISFWGGSTGGTDILYLLLEKYFGIRIGTSLLCITVIILLLSLSYMNYSQFLFTLISCFIFSKTVNFVKYTQFQIPY
ncbi:YitT family protein [Enterococcus sp. DIV0421]|uniref:YitT family protein n=1 Tax=Enterococcus sp. DIV0421 TaxID=2774688 RepID=UPI003F683693